MANTFGINPVAPNLTSPTIAPAVLPNAAPIQPTSSQSTANSNPFQQQVMDAAAGPKCNIVWIKNVDQILAHPTSPNEQMYFGSEDEPVIYVRETDGKGNVKNPLKALHYTVEEVPFGPEAQFVTKDEHKQLYELVERLAKNVDSMNGKLEKLIDG